MEIPRSYRKPLLFAVSVHLAIAIFLIIKLPDWGHSYSYASGEKKTKIMHATAVSSSQVQQAMRDIRYREQAKQRAQAHHLAVLQHRAAVRIAQMKKEQLHLKQQHDRQVAAIAAVKKQARLKKQQAVKLAALAKKRKQQALLVKQKAAQHQKALLAKQQALQQKILAQQLQSDTGQASKVQTAQINGIVDKYKALIQDAVGQQWIVPAGVSKSLSASYDIHLAPGGVVLSVVLLKSSGNTALDQSGQTAIYRASPLPVPTDMSAFDSFRDFQFTVSPQEIVHS